jgi:hypothetical protein
VADDAMMLNRLTGPIQDKNIGDKVYLVCFAVEIAVRCLTIHGETVQNDPEGTRLSLATGGGELAGSKAYICYKLTLVVFGFIIIYS